MLPNQFKYPQFVPDQLLTSEHLNNLFNYLEEQGRLTRTNLLGIGIVCGMEVSVDNSVVALSKGVGITSEGYLVAVPGRKYTHYKPFNAEKERIYNRFVDGSGLQLFDIDELMEAAVEEDTTVLSKAYLKDKVAVIFVELLEEGAKNCNPNSCDDKGVVVNVRFRPLLVNVENAEKLLANLNGFDKAMLPYQSLPVIKMKRFDVAATNLQDTQGLYEAYQKVLNKDFLQQAEQTFTQAYNTLSPILIDEFPSNPFAGIASSFAFLHSGTIPVDKLINTQYYYGLFADLIAAYEEVRLKGLEMLSLCAPGSELFPRHLLLGHVMQESNKYKKPYRQYFIPSPIFTGQFHLVSSLRLLFKRMVLMYKNFEVPSPSLGNNIKRVKDINIRITPSSIGDVPLSAKAIPYYYKVNNSTGKLYEHWSIEKAAINKSHLNLGYHAKEYNPADEFVFSPLLYDLEPYNFLRIEGHIGKPYAHAIKNILAIRNENRLPFEVIALSGDMKNIRQQLAFVSSGNIAELQKLKRTLEPGECHFHDLESLFDTLSAELICWLCKELQYYYAFPGSTKDLPPPNSFIPKVDLLVKCAPAFRFDANTLGHEFEIFYNTIKDQPYVSASIWLSNFSTPSLASNQGTGNVGFGIMYYIAKLSETITADLAIFDLPEFVKRYDDLVKVAVFIKKLLSGIKLGENTNPLILFEDIFDHLDAIIYACKKSAFESIVNDYRARWLHILLLQRFGYYSKLHPGIQHKAGVTMGGTFILVYHEAEVQTGDNNFSQLDGIRKNTPVTELHAGTNSNAETLHTERNFKAMPVYTQVTEQLKTAGIKGFTSELQQQALRQLFINRNVAEVNLEEVISDIADGTVIADFYLPYTCCSDCPPIQYVIKKKPVEEKPSINIDTTEFCSDDKEGYNVEVSPEGGTVSGVGIVTGANGHSFHPTKVDIGDTASKKVILTYTFEGQTATVEVVVYQKPAAAFQFAPVTGSPFAIAFSNTSKFAAKSKWNFGDGEEADDVNPTHDYKKAGEFTATLTVTNGICSASFSQLINLKEQASKTCFPVNDIVSAFNNLKENDPNNFNAFVQKFPAFADIAAMFKKFATLVGEPVEKQVDFFSQLKFTNAASGAQLNFSQAMVTWLDTLVNNFVTEQTDFRTLALSLYRVLSDLAMYIACIQKEDVGKAKIDMQDVFTIMLRHANLFGQFLNSFTGLHKDILKKISQDVAGEIARLKSNNEETQKPVYLKMLNNISEALSKLNL